MSRGTPLLHDVGAAFDMKSNEPFAVLNVCSNSSFRGVSMNDETVGRNLRLSCLRSTMISLEQSKSFLLATHKIQLCCLSQTRSHNVLVTLVWTMPIFVN